MTTANLIAVSETRFCLVDTTAFEQGGEVGVFTGVCGPLNEFMPPDQVLLISEHGRDDEAWYWVVRDNDGLAVIRTGCTTLGKYEAIDDLVLYLSDVDRVRGDFLEELSHRL